MSDSDRVHLEAIRNCTFSGITARSLHFPNIQGTKACPAENFTFDSCVFIRVPESEFPVPFLKHGTAYSSVRPEREVPHHFRNLVFNNCRFVYE